LLDRQTSRLYACEKIAVARLLQTFTQQFASEPLELPPEQFEILAQSIKKQVREHRASIQFDDIAKMIAAKRSQGGRVGAEAGR
jgi:hypothetical protein